MDNPTRWQTVKDYFRFLFCRHKHTQIRTVRGGMEGEEPEILGQLKYCLDCRNTVEVL